MTFNHFTLGCYNLMELVITFQTKSIILNTKFLVHFNNNITIFLNFQHSIYLVHAKR